MVTAPRGTLLPSRSPLLMGFGLAISLVALAVHAWSYRFLTDDAFISFRYARNLANGHGLVFNPGFERVEGYTNFAWVLLLGLASRLGIPPENAANALSLLATVALWALVAGFARRLADDRRASWATLVAPFALALSRSFAVWSTSGLETRLFELLVVAATLRWIHEVEAWSAGRERRAASPWVFALACWTRPDGLLIVGAAAAAGAWWLARSGRFSARRMGLAWWPFVLLVGGHFIFRRLYYGAWLPNTFYAKVEGLWWSSGFEYLAAFALEYALWLWLPLAILGGFVLARRDRGFVPLAWGAALVPYVFYVAAVGGDYFEYRPLDLLFPFLFLLAGEGVRALAQGPRARAIAVVAALAALVGSWELPRQSHRQFPPGGVLGFPGRMLGTSVEARRYLDPAASLFYRAPLLDGLASAHRDLLRDLTRHFVGIRQEEHARFAVSAIDEGKHLRRLIQAGAIPADLHVAMGAVGAIPYYSDLRVLDMQGLTDSAVARSSPARPRSERLMAHDRALGWDEAVARGVDLVAVDAHVLLKATSDPLLALVRDASASGDSICAADVGGGDYLVGLLPRGMDAGGYGRLRFARLTDPGFLASFMRRAIGDWGDTLRARPDHAHARLRLGLLKLATGDVRGAREQYRTVLAGHPDALEAWDGLAWCELQRGDEPSARAALEHAIAVARNEQDPRLPDLERRLEALPTAPRVVSPRAGP